MRADRRSTATDRCQRRFATRAAAWAPELEVFGQDFGYAREQRRGLALVGAATLQRIDGLRAPAHWTAAQFRNASLALAALGPSCSRRCRSDGGIPESGACGSGPPGRFQHGYAGARVDPGCCPQSAGRSRTPSATGHVACRRRQSAGVTVVTALLADKAIAEFMRRAGAGGRPLGRCGGRRPAGQFARPACAMPWLLPGCGDVTWAGSPAAAFEYARQRDSAGRPHRRLRLVSDRRARAAVAWFILTSSGTVA